jgi:hypothetical protein
MVPVFVTNRSRCLAFATVAALAAIAYGCAAPGTLSSRVPSRLNELTVLEIACTAATSEGVQLSDYNVRKIDYDAAGVWTIMFRRKAVTGPGNDFSVVVLDSDGSATIRRAVW